MKNRKGFIVLLAIAICMTFSLNYEYIDASTQEYFDEDIQKNESWEENSWRYKEGRSNIFEERKSVHPNAWDKVNGHFLNSEGTPIPKAQKKGIDVSEHNGQVNWDKVKADGVDFAIIRCGYGSDDESQDDKQWSRNIAECERLDIPYGVYLYSYANTLKKAKSEAKHVLRLLKGHYPEYPIYYDLEDDKMTKPLSSNLKGEIAQAFCSKVLSAGYEVGIYANLDWWTNQLTDEVFKNENWSKWIAQYNTTCDYKGKYDIWQCTSIGKVEGISGNVDINFWMEKEEKEELQYDTFLKEWYVYKDNKIDYTYTGMIENEYGWWYATDGKLDRNYTGMAENKYGWWYLKNGMVDRSYTGMAENKYGWWYLKNGMVDRNYTGIAENKYGWWYLKNGMVDRSYTGIVYENGKEYTVVNGYVESY